MPGGFHRNTQFEALASFKRHEAALAKARITRIHTRIGNTRRDYGHTPANRTDDGLLAAYTSTLPAPPLLSTTLNATHFPTSIAASPSITSLANTGGATTASWGAPTGTTQYPYFLSATITYPDTSTDMRDADLHGTTSTGLNVGAHGQPNARTLFTLQSTDTDFRAYLYQTEGVY